MATSTSTLPKETQEDKSDDFPPIVEDIRVKELRQKKKASPVPSLTPVITDIRFQKQATNKDSTTLKNDKTTAKRSSSQSRGFAPNFKKVTSETSSKTPQYYNPGRPRTYLSDRYSRNRDCRESSSRTEKPVSFGYQYPPAEQQSKGNFKKLPRVESKTEEKIESKYLLQIYKPLAC